MKLIKYEQSGFILETKGGFRLAFDIGNKTPVEKLKDLKPVDAFLVSHIHGDHFYLPNIRQLSPKSLYLNDQCLISINKEELGLEVIKIKSGYNLNIGGVKISYFTVDHGPNAPKPLENLGFMIEAEGLKIYFAGDMFYQSGIDVSKLEVDIALLPVGSFYTFGPEEALDFAKKFKKIGKIIGMHYENSPETKQRFIELAKSSFEV